MAFSSGSGGGPMADINVTPLVDVMLVLLIIFMITAPLMTHKVVVKLPEASLAVKPVLKTPPVTLAIKANGERYWNDVLVTTAALELVSQLDQSSPRSLLREERLVTRALARRRRHTSCSAPDAPALAVERRASSREATTPFASSSATRPIFVQKTVDTAKASRSVRKSSTPLRTAIASAIAIGRRDGVTWRV